MDDRRDDWHHGVDENLASLNAGQRVWEHEQKALRKLLREIDEDLRGSIGKETDGMIGRLRLAETAVQMLKGVIDVDRAGNKGLVGRVEALEHHERTADTRLKVWIAVIGLVSALLVAAVSNLDRLDRLINRPTKDPVDQAIDHVKHPRHKHYAVHYVPADQEDETQ